jgi:hypothetical protein
VSCRLPPESTHLGRLYEEGLKWVLEEIASVHVERVPLALRAQGILDGYGDAGEDKVRLDLVSIVKMA